MPSIFRSESGGEGEGGRWRGAGGAYSFVAYLSHLTIDHASLSRHGAPFLLLIETSNIWTLITLLPYITKTVRLSYSRPVSPSAATIHLLG